MKETNKIILGDVLEVLHRIPNHQRYDVIIVDPPYNIGKDFGNTQDNMPIREYLSWTTQWLNRCLDLLKKDGVLYLYGFSEILARISSKYPIDEQRWLVWHYTNKATPNAKFWQRSHESILCLWQPGEKRPNLEIDQIREPYTEKYIASGGKKRKKTLGRFNQLNKNIQTTYNVHEKGALPRDVIKVPALSGGAGTTERWFMCHDCDNGVFSSDEKDKHNNHRLMKHPTQKPMMLTKKLIESRIVGSNGSVLIPFAGSGSECLVANQLGVEWLGIELNEQFVDFAYKWMDKWKNVVLQ